MKDVVGRVEVEIRKLARAAELSSQPISVNDKEASIEPDRTDRRSDSSPEITEMVKPRRKSTRLPVCPVWMRVDTDVTALGEQQSGFLEGLTNRCNGQRLGHLLASAYTHALNQRRIQRRSRTHLMIKWVKSTTGENVEVRHECSLAGAAAHQHLNTIAAIAPDDHCCRIAWLDGRLPRFDVPMPHRAGMWIFIRSTHTHKSKPASRFPE